MVKITESFCTKNRRYLANLALKPEGVVLHSVGTPQPDARVFLKIWSEDRSPYFTHYVVDDERIFHTMPDDRRCWHVGSPGNGKWLGIEMCEPDTIRYTSGADFKVLDREAAQRFVRACYENAVQLLAELCRRYGWDPEKAILTHGQITAQKLSDTTHADPEHLWSGLELPYDLTVLRQDVRRAMEESGGGEVPAESGSKRNNEPARAYDKGLSGSYTVTASALNVRSGAGTDRPVLDTIPRGTAVRCYGYYTDRSGRWLYVAYEQSGKAAEGFCFADYLRQK